MNDVVLENLKNATIKFLMTEKDFTLEEAEEAVEQSTSENPDIWNENADAKDLANHLASGDDED